MAQTEIPDDDRELLTRLTTGRPAAELVVMLQALQVSYHDEFGKTRSFEENLKTADRVVERVKGHGVL